MVSLRVLVATFLVLEGSGFVARQGPGGKWCHRAVSAQRSSAIMMKISDKGDDNPFLSLFSQIKKPESIPEEPVKTPDPSAINSNPLFSFLEPKAKEAEVKPEPVKKSDPPAISGNPLLSFLQPKAKEAEVEVEVKAEESSPASTNPLFSFFQPEEGTETKREVTAESKTSAVSDAASSSIAMDGDGLKRGIASVGRGALTQVTGAIETTATALSDDTYPLPAIGGAGLFGVIAGGVSFGKTGGALLGVIALVAAAQENELGALTRSVGNITSTFGTIAFEGVKAEAPGIVSTTYTAIRSQAQDMSVARKSIAAVEEAGTPEGEPKAPRRITAELDMLNELKAEREAAAKESAEFRSKTKEALDKAMQQ